MGKYSAIVGARGFGLPSARRLGLHGKLLLGDVSEQVLADSAGTLRLEGFDVETRRVDVSDRASVAAFADVAKAMGDLHCLLVTAGISPRSASPDRILEVNMLGNEFVKEAFEPLLVDGSIGILFSSNAAYYNPVPGHIERDLALLPTDRLIETAKKVKGWDTGLGAYWLAKRCLQLRVEASARRWGEHGARILTISPGIFETEMSKSEREMGSAIDETAKATPIGRLGKAEEMASLVEWVTSPAAGYLTGTDILMDGGMVSSLRWGGMTTEDPQDANSQHSIGR